MSKITNQPSPIPEVLKREPSEAPQRPRSPATHVPQPGQVLEEQGRMWRDSRVNETQQVAGGRPTKEKNRPGMQRSLEQRPLSLENRGESNLSAQPVDTHLASSSSDTNIGATNPIAKSSEAKGALKTETNPDYTQTELEQIEHAFDRYEEALNNARTANERDDLRDLATEGSGSDYDDDIEEMYGYYQEHDRLPPRTDDVFDTVERFEQNLTEYQINQEVEGMEADMAEIREAIEAGRDFTEPLGYFSDRLARIDGILENTALPLEVLNRIDQFNELRGSIQRWNEASDAYLQNPEDPDARRAFAQGTSDFIHSASQVADLIPIVGNYVSGMLEAVENLPTWMDALIRDTREAPIEEIFRDVYIDDPHGGSR